MLLRLKTLATGHTGVRPVVAETMAALLERRHHPGRARVRLARLLRRPGAARRTSRWSLMGEGEVDRRGRQLGRAAAGSWPSTASRPLELAPKEGLALINGTDGMLGMLILALRRPRRSC